MSNIPSHFNVVKGGQSRTSPDFGPSLTPGTILAKWRQIDGIEKGKSMIRTHNQE